MLCKKSMQINVAKYRHLGTSLSRSKKKAKKNNREIDQQYRMKMLRVRTLFENNAKLSAQRMTSPICNIV